MSNYYGKSMFYAIRWIRSIVAILSFTRRTSIFTLYLPSWQECFYFFFFPHLCVLLSSAFGNWQKFLFLLFFLSSEAVFYFILYSSFALSHIPLWETVIIARQILMLMLMHILDNKKKKNRYTLIKGIKGIKKLTIQESETLPLQ